MKIEERNDRALWGAYVLPRNVPTTADQTVHFSPYWQLTIRASAIYSGWVV